MPYIRSHFTKLLLSLGFYLIAYSPVIFANDGYELVYNAPAETTLKSKKLPNTADLWLSIFNNAKESIDIGQFYLADAPDSKMNQVFNALDLAGKRGVKIRFLMEKQGVKISTPETIERLKAIPNLTLRIIPYHDICGGIMHAKYFIVDHTQAYVGSANFDWRALEHIQETGVHLTDPTAIKQVSAIFEQDWQSQQQLTEHKDVTQIPLTPLPKNLREGNYLIASPAKYLPSGVVDSQQVLPLLLASAKNRIRIQVMTYSPLSFAEKGHPAEYYPVIDNAIRSAATRGVKVELMVADWNYKGRAINYLKSLAILPNITIKIITIPEAHSGKIPFARVIHSKIMTIDKQLAWVGTSNWSGGYFDNSRNLELVMNNSALAKQLDQIYEKLWNSQYAKVLRCLPLNILQN